MSRAVFANVEMHHSVALSEPSRTSPNMEDLPCELVAGRGCIHEELLGLKFRISPHSFFQVPRTHQSLLMSVISSFSLKLWKQVNTGAAEVLYSAVGEWAQLDEDSTVLDVCCGTGTIGISLAKVTSLLCIIILQTQVFLFIYFF